MTFVYVLNIKHIILALNNFFLNGTDFKLINKFWDIFEIGPNNYISFVLFTAINSMTRKYGADSKVSYLIN